MEEQSINILERIHISYYQLSAAERKVADYVLAQHSQVQFMSITQLADECGVAEATVSRFCRSLALKGFNAFKLEAAKHAATSSARGIREFPPAPDTLEGRSQETCRLSLDAIHQTMEMLRYPDIHRAIDLFDRAGRVYCMGSGGSMILAQECSHLFSTISGKFSSVWDSHMQMSAVATMDTTDVVVLFSYSGATHNGIAVLELAKARGISSVLITRFPKSPAAQLADVVLQCGSNESPFQFGSVPARVAQLVLLDVLYQEYLHRHRQRSEANLQRIAAALSEKHL